MSIPILRARDIIKKLGGKTILDGVSLDVFQGDVKVIIGPSGAGKSTFLQCLNYLIPPDSGEILLEGVPVDAAPPRRFFGRFLRTEHDADGGSTLPLNVLRREVGMIFQDFNLFDHLTAEENVAVALRKVLGYSRAQAAERARAELARVGLSGRGALYPAQLSGGQKQRVAIARALSNEPLLILADEPTGNLDSKSSNAVIEAFLFAREQLGATVLMVTHDAIAASHADRVIALSDGMVVRELVRQKEQRQFMNDILEFLKIVEVGQ